MPEVENMHSLNDNMQLLGDIVSMEEGDKIDASWRKVRLTVEETEWTSERDYNREVEMKGRRGEFTLQFNAGDIAYKISSKSRGDIQAEHLSITNRSLYPSGKGEPHMEVYLSDEELTHVYEALRQHVLNILGWRSARRESHTEKLRKNVLLAAELEGRDEYTLSGASPLKIVKTALNRLDRNASYHSDIESYKTGDYEWDKETHEEVIDKIWKSQSGPAVIRKSVQYEPGEGDVQCTGHMDENGIVQGTEFGGDAIYRCSNYAEIVKTHTYDHHESETGLCRRCAKKLWDRARYQNLFPIFEAGFMNVKEDKAKTDLKAIISRLESKGQHPLEVSEELEGIISEMESEDEPIQMPNPSG